MSLPDTVFIFVLALIIFGPKKLPEIGRQLGKLVGEFRRASNEFKFQIEEELRQVELNDRQTIAPPAKELDSSSSDPSPASSTESAASASSDLPDVEETLPAGQYPNIDNLDRSDLGDLNQRLADSDTSIERKTDEVAGEIAPASPTITPAAGTEPRSSFPHSISEPDVAGPTETATSSVSLTPEPESAAASANSPLTANATPLPERPADDPYSAPVVADITHG